MATPSSELKEPKLIWHSETPEAVQTTLASGPEGLTASEATLRLQTYGPNVLQKAKGDGPLQILWRQINSPLIWVLIGAGALAIAMGKGVDGIVVLAVVVLNTLIGFVQEYRASQAIDALSQMVPQVATVVRDGERQSIPTADLVPGDVVMLASGDRVPADMRLVTVRNLQVQEAALTGESVPTEKSVDAVIADAEIGDRIGMAFGGTLVTYGTATGVVVTTGQATELGRINQLLNQASDLQTPLTHALEQIAKYLTIAILIVSVALAGVSYFRGYLPVDAILVAITLAVAAIPEGLPAIVTIALAIGVQRMAARRAVIRKLPAVETLGSTTVICSDKTGTLTRNEMTVQALWTSTGSFEVSGVGYEPKGQLMFNGHAVELTRELRELIEAGLLCNDSELKLTEGRYGIVGDPTEGALVVVAEKLGVSVEKERTIRKRLDAIPFESQNQYMATLHSDPTGGRVLVIKGAPEVVTHRCLDCMNGDAVPVDAIHAQIESMANAGMRVLGFAIKTMPEGTQHITEDDVKEGLTFLGLQGMIDPPRTEAIESIRACHQAGIVVKMITGDHKLTARAIGGQLGILNEGGAYSGHDIELASDEELKSLVRKANVFARVAPEHKLRLVKALQATGNVVAMTGDGVNDAPALKQSNIGVAMGITGTDVSKESSDIVLTDDNFASIAAAVEEGRRVYDNLIKSLAFVLPTNLGLAFILSYAVTVLPIQRSAEGVAEPLLPMLPTQLLWINLVATVALALPLAFEAKEPNVMNRPPRDPAEPVLSRFVVARTLIAALLMAAGAIGLFQWEYWREVGLVGHQVALAEAQTMAVTTVIMFQIFYMLNCRSLRDSIFRIGLFSNPTVYVGIAALLGLQGIFIYAPFMQGIFGTANLDAKALGLSVLVGAVILPVISLEKWILSRRGR